jgi:hypothetical protein
MTLKIDGQLEIDVARGVLYFHSGENGSTVLRICGLEFPKGFSPSQNNFDMLDVTLKLVEPHPVLYSMEKKI